MAGTKRKPYKPVLVVALVVAGGALVVFTVLVWRSLKAPPVPEIPALPEPLVVEIVSRATSSAESTRQWVYQQGRSAYSLTGRFVDLLRPVGDSLRGTFVIDGDPNDTKIAVVIRSSREDGLYSLGKYKDEFGEGHMQASLVSLAVIMEGIKQGEPAELRFMYHPTVTPRGEETRTREILDALLQDQWEIPSGLTLTPVGIGILE